MENVNKAYETSPQQEYWLKRSNNARQQATAVSLRMGHPLDIGKLQNAFEHIFNTRDALKSVPLDSNASTVPLMEHITQPNIHFSNLERVSDVDAVWLTFCEDVIVPTFQAKVQFVSTGLDENFVFVQIPFLYADSDSIVVLLEDIFSFYWDLYESKEEQFQYSDIAGYLRGIITEKESEPFINRVQHGLSQLPSADSIMRSAVDQNAPVCSEELLIGEAIVNNLKSLSSALAIPEELIPLACLGVLCSRLNARDDIAINTRFSGRVHDELSDAVGLYEKQIPFVVTVDATTSFKQYLTHIKQTYTELLSLQEYYITAPDEVAYQSEFSYGYYDFSSIAAKLRNRAVAVGSTADIVVQKVKKLGYCSSSAVDVQIIKANPADRILRICSRLPASLDAWPGIIAQQFYTLLQGVLEKPEAPLSRLAIVSPKENWLPVSSNRTRREAHNTFLHAFFRQVNAEPDNLAIQDKDKKYSYLALAKRAFEIADSIGKRDIGSNTPIAICMARSFNLLAAIIAVHKVGAAYLPIDPDTPKERLRFVIEDSNTVLAIVDDTSEGRVTEAVPELKVLKTDEVRARERNPILPLNESALNSLAYVIYTSGSTGQPKGTLISQKGLANYLEFCRKDYPYSTVAGALLHSSIAFDATITTMLAPLTTGSFIEILAENDISSLAATLSADSAYGVVKITPAHMLALTEFGLLAGSVAKVDAFVIGGEILEWDLLAKWVEKFPRTRFINEYGPTETVVGCVVYSICGSIERRAAVVPIGKPIDNTEIRLLDASKTAVTIGAVGEIYIAGEGVAIGYNNRPEENEKAFLNLEFGGESDRYYRTGDLAYYLPSGDLVCIGRRDQQVKLNGHRVELGEIENAIKRCTGLDFCKVLLHQDAANTTVVAFARFDGGRSELPNLTPTLENYLPKYMLPNVYVPLATVPTTINGKLDIEVLWQHFFRHQAAQAVVQPSTETETVLLNLWTEVFGCDQIGVTRNFFELGGDSIQTIKIVARANRLGINISSQDFFSAQDIRSLAALADRSKSKNSDSSRTPLELFQFVSEATREVLLSQSDSNKLPVIDAYPMTSMQWSMYTFAQLDDIDSYSSYVDVTITKIQAELNPDLLQQALSKLVFRHDILRASVYGDTNGVPLLRIHAPEVADKVASELVYDDISGDDCLVDRAVEALFEKEKRFKFNVNDAPLFKLRILKGGENTYYLSFVRHHLILDGWSAAVFMTELFNEYRALLAETQRTHIAPSLPFADYVNAEREASNNQALADYWQTATGAVVPGKIPVPLYTAASGDASGRHIREVPISSTLSDAVKAKANAYGVPVKTVLLAVHLLLLARLSGERSVSTGLVLNNRLDKEGGDTALGLFLNTLPISVNFQSLTWSALLTEVQKQEVQVYQNRRLPLNRVIQLSGGQQLFDTLFNFVNFHIYSDVINSGEMTFETVYEFEKVNYPYVIYSRLNAGSQLLEYDIHYDPSVYPDEQVESLTKLYLQLFESFVTNVNVEMHGASHNLNCNDTSVEFESEDCLHALVLNQFRRKPDAVAIIDKGMEITYRQIISAAVNIAAQLYQLNVVSGDRVAVCMPRNYAQVAAVLAVHIAGAAYLPVAVDLPSDRQNELMTLCGARICLVVDQSHIDIPGVELVRVTPDYLDMPIDDERLDALEFKSESIAYIIFTSGSTGQPKGVAITHASAVNTILDVNSRFGVTESDIALGISELNFDLSVYDIFGALGAGGTLVIVADDVKKEPAAWLQLINRHHVTLWNSVPALADMLVSHIESLPDAACFSLKHIWLSGDYIAPTLPDRLRAITQHDVGIISMGGATEASIWSIFYTIPPGCARWAGIPYGRPLANQEIYVLDADLNLAQDQEPGQIYIGGVGLAQCYWNNEERTQNAFVYHASLNKRLYKTGDMGRWQYDGQVEFLGRLDTQVKINGFRIELGEIETFLKRHPDIQNAVTIVVTIEGRSHILAYVQKASESECTDRACDRYLRGLLPNYMQPSRYLFVESFPVTSNGKIDRSSLPIPESLADNEREIVVPETDTEVLLCSQFKNILNLQNVSILDNFFEVGGDSLLAMRLVNCIKEEAGVVIPLMNIFGSPTLRDIAGYIDAVKLNESNSSVVEEEMTNGVF